MKSSRRDFIKNSALLGIGISSFSFGIRVEESKSEELLSKIGLCTSISNSKILISSGYSYLEEGVRSFLVPTEPEDVFDRKTIILKEAGIPIEACNSFLPGEIKCVGPDLNNEKLMQYTETAFRRAKKTGIKTIVFGSSGSRNIPEGFPKTEAKKQFIEVCRQMATIAQKNDIIISLEPLNKKECNFINTVREGGEIVKFVDNNNFRLLADIYHMLMENEGPESLVTNGKFLNHIHIAEKEGCAAPGVHGEDFTAYFKALKQVGYKGRMSVECNWDKLEIQAPMALKALREQINSI
jgi:sugar phosphate isomerase/epimerase